MCKNNYLRKKFLKGAVKLILAIKNTQLKCHCKLINKSGMKRAWNYVCEGGITLIMIAIVYLSETQLIKKNALKMC